MRLAKLVAGPDCRRVLVLACMFGASSAGRSAAGPIFTGDGAAAWVVGPAHAGRQSGGAPASISGSATVGYTTPVVKQAGDPSSVVLEPATLTASYSAYAAASPTALGAPLLELRGATSSPNPGDAVGVRSPDPGVEMGAVWGGVIATVAGPAGGGLPEAIRLNFELAYTPPSEIREEYPNRMGWPQEISPTGDGYGYVKLPGEWETAWEGQGDVVRGADGLLHMSYGLTLPLSATGESRAFGVGLATRLDGFIERQEVRNSSVSRLSLASITLPDGTGLEAAGYTLTFDSGNPMPPPNVPEPTTWLAWAALAVGSARLVRRED